MDVEATKTTISRWFKISIVRVWLNSNPNLLITSRIVVNPMPAYPVLPMTSHFGSTKKHQGPPACEGVKDIA